MRKASIFFTSYFLLLTSLQASWYWPFGKDESEEPDQPRLSELMEPATTNIDAAADFAAEGKFKEAQDSYRAAIAALNKIEAENPERAATPEFATVRNKRAYINAALDSMLLAEARDNAKAVSVTDTTDLEVRLVLKPWDEFQPTYASLTNADSIAMMRVKFVESAEVRAILNAVTDPKMQKCCVAGCKDLAQVKSRYVSDRDLLAKSYRTAVVAIARMEKFSKNAASPEGVRIFDVCKKDARAGIAECKGMWPKVGEELDALNKCLETLHGALLEIAAKKDFPEIAKAYVDNISGRKPSDAQAMAEELGCLRACTTMLGELDAAGAGVVHKGALYRMHSAWGGVDPDVPQQEDDRGLVKDDSDMRPKVESQVEEYVEKERKRSEKIQRAATKAKVRKSVQIEVKKLLKEDPKSRRARMLMAGEDLRNGDLEAAKEKVKVLLDEKPNDGPALNMRAAIEAAAGDLKNAEKTLDQAIQSNPRDYHAYYNMANIYIQKGNVDSAKRYYETGRAFAGPKNVELEKALKR